MARIRSIKPDFWTSEQVMACSPVTRLLFIGMWNFADDHGRLPANPKTIKAQVFPGDEDITSENVRRMVDELSTNGLVMLYEVDNKQYLLITGWRHQKIDKRQDARFPDPPRTFDERSTNAPRWVSTDRIGADTNEVRKKDAAPSGAHSAQGQGRQDHPDKSTADDPWKHFFARGSEVLGPRAGGILTNLKKAKDGVLSHAMSALEMAAGTSDPKSYVMAIVNRSGANSMLENQYPPERDPRL